MDEKEVIIWSRWKATQCENAKTFLYEKYKQWADLEALFWFRRLNHVSADRQDFSQYANLGLLEAMESFDIKKGVQFKSFAQYRIKGVILNNVFNFSDNSSYKHVQYQKREKNQITDAIESNGLVTTIEELAIEYLLEQSTDSQPTNFLDGFYYSSPEMEKLKQNCKLAVEKLGDPKGAIVSLHYFLEKTLTEIANVLDLTVGRVSQLKKTALEEIYEFILKH
ncbi:sigma-70 family RNA polymerase sigma factor [Pseudoalteromonas piscicida]|uniref:sigma-70 family RNA polymerase sigma factor n=1 Tax=Pseudoalteromonas piscicida TaxID=43662 RepID=UPI003C7B3821